VTIPVGVAAVASAGRLKSAVLNALIFDRVRHAERIREDGTVSNHQDRTPACAVPRLGLLRNIQLT
jgi:hypothetical protein